MALINCPKCNKEISDQDTKCSHCGAVLTETNSVSTLCKFTSVIIFIAVFIGTIVVCSTETYAYYGTKIEFNWTAALISWVSSFLLCLILFAVGEIINQLAISNANSSNKRQQNEKLIQELLGGQYQETAFDVSDDDE